MIAPEIERMKSYQHVCEGITHEDDHMMVEMCEGYVIGFIQLVDTNVVFGGSFILLIGKSKLNH